MIGIISAFAAAISWTYACFIWRSQTNKYKSIDINFLKNIIAFIIFLPAFFKMNLFINTRFIILLLISGVIGIGIGDTFYLKSLQLIGTRRTLSVEALSPLLAAFSGTFFINESLFINSWIGILIVTISIIIILKKKISLIDQNLKLSKDKVDIKVYVYPFLSVFSAVAGGVLSRIVFLESNLSPLQTTEIRLLGALIFLIIIKRLKINFFLNDLKKLDKIKFITSIIFGTNLGILLQQIVFKTLPIGIGWTLLSTTPVIALFFAKNEEGILSKETIFFTVLLFIGLCLTIL